MVSFTLPALRDVSIAEIEMLDPVTSAVVHLSGTVVATCSGQRNAGRWRDEISESEADDSDASSSSSSSSRALYDNRLAVWAL
jgi:hypothetical protein